MNTKIVCHIGLHKTASGTLQRQFFPNCGELNLLTTLQPYTREFIQNVTKRDPSFFDSVAARQILEKHLSTQAVNLISNESLSGPPYAGVVESSLDHRTPVLENLRSVFPEARILIVLRRQDHLARSLYRQYLKRGGTARIDRFFGVNRIGKLALMSEDRFRYSIYIDLLRKLFPAGVKVLLFEDFITNPAHFLDSMCQFIGIRRPDVQLIAENATRLGPFAMEGSRYMNFFFRSMLNRGPLPQLPRKQFGRWTLVSPVEYMHDYWPGSGRPSKHLAEVCATILDRMAGDNQLIEESHHLGMHRHDYFR